MYEPHLPQKDYRCHAKSLIAQDTFQPIPGFINCTRVTGGCGLLSKCSQVASLIKHSHMHVLASPKALPKNQERGLVTLANFLVCAESAYYVTILCLM